MPLNPVNRKLIGWLNAVRVEQRRGVLDPALKRELEVRGVPLSAADLAWERRFAAFADLRRARGHLRLGGQTPLGRWLEQQRSLAAQGELEPGRRRRLNELGFAV